jgi:hypothetical protein
VETAAALAHLAAGRQQGVGEAADLLFWLAQQMERQPLGGARPDAGQPLELVDQAGQGPGEAAQGTVATGRNLGASAEARAVGGQVVSPTKLNVTSWYGQK